MSAVNAPVSQQSKGSYTEPRSSEPTMEDILASIRRIIADDQSRTSSMATTLRRPIMPEPAVAAPEADGPEIEHPDERHPAGVADEQEAPQAKAEPTVLVDDEEPVFQAESRAEVEPLELDARYAVPPYPEDTSFERPQSFAMPHLNPPLSDSQVTAEPDPVAHSTVIDEIAHAGMASILNPRSAVAQPEPEPEPAFADDRWEPEPAIEAEASAAEDPAEPSEHDVASAQPLISPTVVASVESSFQALAKTVLLQNTDMVERMTRDMLRPLLKTWLDDNLPTIVERLVRAEIERVARGGRG